MNTPLAMAPRPSSHPRPQCEEAELLSLAELLALFAEDEDEAATTSTRGSLRSSGAVLRGWARDSSRRAARWGAVADVPGGHGARSSRTLTEVAK